MVFKNSNTTGVYKVESQKSSCNLLRQVSLYPPKFFSILEMILTQLSP